MAKKQGVELEFSILDDQFKSAIKDMNASISSMRKELSLENEVLKSSSVSVNDYQKKINTLREQQEISKNKIKETSEAYEKAKQMLGENSKEASKYKDALVVAQLEHQKITNEIDKTTNAMKDYEEQLEDVSDAEEDASNHAITFGEMIKANLISDTIKAGLKEIANITKEIGSFFIDIGKQAFESYGEYEQLVGGVDTLFKESSSLVQEYANNAYKSSGLSANKYMETVTSFSASLLQSLNNDTVEAAKVADMAIVDMSDNANKMGTDISSIQNAYQGFAKGQYQLLDNLKLGYGGTKTEMERLLADAEKITGIKYDISNLSDVYQAIHVIQGELSITGTTAKEASTTIQGSISSLTSAWTNLLAGLGNKDADLNLLVKNLIDSAITVLDNAIPVIEAILNSLISALPSIFEMGAQILTNLIDGIIQNIPILSSVVITVLTGLVNTILQNLPSILQAGITLIVELAKGISLSLPTLVPTMVSVILEMVTILTNPENLQSIIEAALVLVTSLTEGIINSIPVLVKQLPEIINNITKFFDDNLDKIIDTGVDMIINLTMSLVDSIPVILENLPTIINAIVNGLLKIIPKLATAGLQMMIKFGSALIENIPQVVSRIPQIISSIINGFGNLLSVASEIGRNFVTGLWNGIDNAKDWILGKIRGFKDSVLSGIKSFFGIHSPSTVFRDEVGKNLALGLGEGFTNEMESVTDNMQNAIPTTFDIDTNNLVNGFSNNLSDSGTRSITDTSDYTVGQVAPIYLTIENFNNNRSQDIEDLSEELAFYGMKNAYGRGVN